MTQGLSRMGWGRGGWRRGATQLRVPARLDARPWAKGRPGSWRSAGTCGPGCLGGSQTHRQGPWVEGPVRMLSGDHSLSQLPSDPLTSTTGKQPRFRFSFLKIPKTLTGRWVHREGRRRCCRGSRGHFGAGLVEPGKDRRSKMLLPVVLRREEPWAALSGVVAAHMTGGQTGGPETRRRLQLSALLLACFSELDKHLVEQLNSVRLGAHSEQKEMHIL